MKKKAATTTPTGLQAFMDATEIDGFPVREWTTQQFCELYPTLRTIVDKLTAKGMNLESFDVSKLGTFLPTIADAVIPVMMTVITISCPDQTDEDRKALKWPRAIQLTMGILKVNIEHLADFFGQSPE